MPLYRRGYRRRFRRYRRYGRRYRRRSYARRYINASSRSSIRVKCVVTNSYQKTSGYGTTLGTVFSVNPFDRYEESLQASPLYTNYCNLYEEVKMIGMKIAVNVITPVGGASLPSLEIYTMFDRRHGDGEPTPTATEIKEAASMNVATALNNNVAKITRSIYASDLIEKAQWIDSTQDILNGNRNLAWHTAGLNPNFFCPSFNMCFGSPSLTQAAQANVSFSVSITYYVAFRNPKYGGSAASKDLPARSVTFAEPPDDGGDDEGMADGDPLRLADIEAYRFNPEEPAGAAAAAAAPALLGRRQRSTASQENRLGEPPSKKN